MQIDMNPEMILHYFSVYSVIIPVITGLFLYKKLDQNSRIMVLLLTFASVAQLASFLPSDNQKFRFFNIYCVLDSAIWGYLFYKNSKNKTIKNSIAVIIMLQVIVSIWVFAVSGLKERFYTEFVCLSSLLQVLWVLSFFYERYKREEIQALEKEPMFWFCLGILVYAPATYFRFVYFHEVDDLESLHDLLNTGMYFTFTVGILANVIRTSKFRDVFIRNQS
jgi:hypothetical protein